MIARLTAMLALVLLPATTCAAQDIGRETPAIVPLVARHAEADGALAIGGGPEAGDVALRSQR